MPAVHGCSDAAAPDVPDTAPFPYHGSALHFPEGTVEARSEEGEGFRAYARLLPDAPTRGQSRSRYLIDLGRENTGQERYGTHWLGFMTFPPGSQRVGTGGGYVMFCPPPKYEVLDYDCSVLLRALPRAAVAFRKRPHSRAEARAIIEEAEAFLTQAATS